jgi:four helix bundle protein
LLKVKPGKDSRIFFLVLHWEVPKVPKVPRVPGVLKYSKSAIRIKKVLIMENKEFGKQLELRTKKFAICIIKLSSSLPDSVEGKVIKYQITKSGTSIGANYREANRSRSKPDFSNKITICESESSETGYWLEIIDEMNWLQNKGLNLYRLNQTNYWQFLHQ